jgi:uroporphyrinogen-III synthase
LDEALAATVSFAIALVNCDRCFIYVQDGAELALWVWKHLDQEEPEHTKLPLGKGYTALLAEHPVPLAISSNSREEPANEMKIANRELGALEAINGAGD